MTKPDCPACGGTGLMEQWDPEAQVGWDEPCRWCARIEELEAEARIGRAAVDAREETGVTVQMASDTCHPQAGYCNECGSPTPILATHHNPDDMKRVRDFAMLTLAAIEEGGNE